MQKVYYSEELERLVPKLKEELKKEFSGCKRIAVKIHFGEPGNKTTFEPSDIKPIADTLKELGFDFFFFDSPVAYSGPRNMPETHKKAAEEKGWGKIGKIVISDDYIEQKGENMDYQVCKDLIEADAVLVVSHFKGHPCSGFGAAVKNLGMGALTKKTKQDIHDGGEPMFMGGCIKCGACERACPLDAIKVEDEPKIVGGCFGCSICAYKCPNGTIKPKVNFFDVLLAEGAAAARSRFKKDYYVTYMKNITKKCDCEKNAGEIIAKDAGFVMGKDPVSVDKAGHDVIADKEGAEVFLKHNQKTGVEHLEAASIFGMGEMEYELERL